MVVRIPFKWRILLGIALGLVQAVCFPPVGFAMLLPLCVATFFLLLTGLKSKLAFVVGFLYGLAWFLADLFWFTNLFGPAALSLCAILAFFTGLFAALLVWLQRRLPQIPAWLLAAVLWTGVEYFRSEPFILNFGWLGLGYAVVNDHLLARCASWFGCYGVTFLIVACAGLLAGQVSRGRPGTSGGLAIFGAFVLLYAIPLPPPSIERPLHIRLVQANSEDDESHFGLSQPIVGSPVDVIVWPEYSFVSDPRHQPRLWKKITSVARINHAYLLLGAKDEFNPADPAGYRNTAFLLDREGRVVGTHVKNHTVHFFRDGAPGTKARAIPTDIGRIGVAICFDMDYPDVARRLAADGAEVFLVPSDDPPEWGAVQRIQHRMMFQMRALECGRWLARADVAGGTSLVLPTGREETRVSTTAPTKLDVTVGRLSGKTLFVRGGWRFGPFCFVALLGLCIWGLMASRLATLIKGAI